MSNSSFARTMRVAPLCLALLATALATSCGETTFTKSTKQNARNEALAAEQDPGCLKLGGEGVYPPAPVPTPAPLPLPPAKGDESVNPPPPVPPTDGSNDDSYGKPGPCGQNPGQTPGQTPNYPGQNPGKDYPPVPMPVPNYPGQNPGQYPSQHPIDPNTCGKGAEYCDNGGPGQWPPFESHGGGYDRSDVQACTNAFHSQSFDTRGQ